MTRRDDRFADMLSSARFDAAIERILRGEAVDDDVAPVARFVDDMRVMADGPPPPPSAELAALLAGGAPDGALATVTPLAPPRPGAVPRRRGGTGVRRSRAAGVRLRVAALGVAGKAALILAFLVGIAAGGAAGVLPAPVSNIVRRAIEVVTPFELPDDAFAQPGRGSGPKHDTGVATPGGVPTTIPERKAVTAGPAPGAESDAGAGTAAPGGAGAREFSTVGADAQTDASSALAPTQDAPPATLPADGDPEDPPPPPDEPATNPPPKDDHAPPVGTPPVGTPPVGTPPVGTPAGDPPAGGPPAGDPPIPAAADLPQPTSLAEGRRPGGDAPNGPGSSPPVPEAPQAPAGPPTGPPTRPDPGSPGVT